MPLAPGNALGPYRIVAPIGAGGMGEVYQAVDARLDRRVAIKVLPASFAGDQERLRRFEREARATSALNHPNILTVHDFGTYDGSPYLVTELLEGSDLRAELHAGAVTVAKALDYARQIAAGLAAAHDRDVTHRDLKPENLFVTTDGRLKILDFGLARVGPHRDGPTGSVAATEYAVTAAGAVMGTVGYMSPEQVRGQPADHRSDIFSFGVILYELIAGRPTFRGESAVETMNAILKDDPGDLAATGASITPALDRIVRRCLEKKPERRFQSAHDLGFALESLAGSTVSPKVHRDDSGPARGRRLALGAALAFGALAVGFVAGATWFRGAGPLAAGAPTRFVIPLPADSRLTGLRPLAISGDGRNLAMSLEGADASRQIYRRDLERVELSPLQGTRGAESPFFSPDGRWVGWVAEDETLKKSPIAGGTAVPIADDAGTGTWGEDEHIIFHHRNRLSRVPAATGTPQPITTLNGDGSFHSRPAVVPGARAVLFEIVATTTRHSTIAVVSLDTGRQYDLLPGDNPHLAPTGHLLFQREGTLWAIAFDRDRLSVARAGTQFSDSFAPDGTLAFNENPPIRDIWILPPRGEPRPFLNGPANERSAAFSPDGRLIAYVSDESGRDEVYLRTYPGPGATVPVSTKGGRTPVWSRDGRELFYFEEARLMAVTVVPAVQVSPPRLLFEARWADRDTHQASFDVSPDGKRFVMIRMERAGAPEQIHVVLDWLEELRHLVPIGR